MSSFGGAAWVALLRWRSPTLGDVGPDEFIPIAERTGLIMPIGRILLTRAIEQLRHWHADGNEDLTVSVNVSEKQLTDEQLPDRISQLCQQYLVFSRPREPHDAGWLLNATQPRLRAV